MRYIPDILEAHTDPERLETLYNAARKQRASEEFIQSINACYQQSPQNMLYAAWHFRLQREHAKIVRSRAKNALWKLAIPMGILNGLIFWAFSSENLVILNHLPHFLLLWAPITAFFVIGFITFTARLTPRQYLPLVAGLVATSLYILLMAQQQARPYYRDYLNLMALHLPLVAWTATGVSLLGWKSDAENRFAFLMKSLEVMITTGVFIIAGGAFAAITIGMFEALNVELPETILRFIFAGGGGLIPLLAVATVYDPLSSPKEQDFEQGLSRFIATMMRLLLPLTLLVLVIYIIAIPFNFMQPFENREVLFVYNVMLFAIMGLLIGATPVANEELSSKFQSALRTGILAVAILATLVSLYALSAIVYRTIQGGLTINRLTVIGWNSVNIGILIVLIIKQFIGDRQTWVDKLKSTYRIGTVAYIIWGLVTTIAIPLVFR